MRAFEPKNGSHKKARGPEIWESSCGWMSKNGKTQKAGVSKKVKLLEAMNHMEMSNEKNAFV